MTQHTQGPWNVNLNDDGFINPVVENESQYICVLEGGSTNNQIANARLISAAPELLEAASIALKAFQMDSDLEEDFSPEIRALRMAIAKAKGE